jgi:hypothetical protein
MLLALVMGAGLCHTNSIEREKPTMFTVDRVAGNDYATDLGNALRYYTEMHEAYAAVDNKDEDYFAKLTANLEWLKVEWQRYLDMLGAKKQGCFF